MFITKLIILFFSAEKVGEIILDIALALTFWNKMI